jgi:hypothetical protein
MVHIYVLELVEGKYYVGKTNNPGFRIDQHFHSGGATWTRKYRPIRIVEIINDCDDYDEDKYTRIYMDNYGIENVRGGSFCEEVLDETTVKMLEKMSNTTKNKCFICGKVGHFAKECGTCNNLEDMDKCLVTLETFIKEKKELEKVNVPFEIPTKENGGVPMHNRELGHFIGHRGGKHENDLLINEYIRTKEQKKKNEEYIPMFEVIHKSLQLLHEKIEEQKQSPPNTSLVNDLLLQFSKQQGISIDEETISKLLRGLF